MQIPSDAQLRSLPMAQLVLLQRIVAAVVDGGPKDTPTVLDGCMLDGSPSQHLPHLQRACAFLGWTTTLDLRDAQNLGLTFRSHTDGLVRVDARRSCFVVSAHGMTAHTALQMHGVLAALDAVIGRRPQGLATGRA